MKIIIRLFLACLVLFNLSCAAMKPQGDNESSVPSNAASGPANFYSDFDDILIPQGMSLIPRSSFVVETANVKAGMLVFRGRIDPVSLTNFFNNNMLKDGWQLSSSFRYPRTIMVFTKPDRDCIINIHDGRLTTEMEIWIAPKVTSTTPASALHQGRPLSQ